MQAPQRNNRFYRCLKRHAGRGFSGVARKEDCLTTVVEVSKEFMLDPFIALQPLNCRQNDGRDQHAARSPSTPIRKGRYFANSSKFSHCNQAVHTFGRCDEAAIKRHQRLRRALDSHRTMQGIREIQSVLVCDESATQRMFVLNLQVRQSRYAAQCRRYRSALYALRTQQPSQLQYDGDREQECGSRLQNPCRQVALSDIVAQQVAREDIGIKRLHGAYR